MLKFGKLLMTIVGAPVTVAPGEHIPLTLWAVFIINYNQKRF